MAEGPPRPGITAPLTRTAKIVIIGSASTGKTSLRNRYAKGHFSQAYIATIGADFVTKKVELQQQDGSAPASASTVTLQLWDTAGQERFQALGAAFYRGADACILVYALNSPDSLHKIKSWYTSFLDRCPVPEGQERSFPFVCVGNKSDLVQSQTRDYADAASNKHDENVDVEEVKKMLEELCPPLEKESGIKKTAQPSAVPSGSDAKTAKVQQEHDLCSDEPSSSSSLKKSRTRSSSSKSHKKRNDPQRRSLEILPDRRDTTTASSVRNPSIYHTPSSSLAQPSTWLNASKVSASSSGDTDEGAEGSISKGKKKNKKKETFIGTEYSNDGIPAGPHGTERAIEEEEEETDYNSEEEGDIHMNGHVPFNEDYEQEEGHHTMDNDDQREVPSKDVFGAQDGIKHFVASAKTGENIDEIFDYLVKRIDARWKWQDELDAAADENEAGGGTARGRIGNVKKGGPNDSIMVGTKVGNNEQKGWRAACC